MVKFGPLTCPSAPDESIDYVLSNCIVRITLTGLILICLVMHCIVNCTNWWMQSPHDLNERKLKCKVNHAKLKNKAKLGKRLQSQYQEQERLKRCRDSLQSDTVEEEEDYLKAAEFIRQEKAKNLKDSYSLEVNANSKRYDRNRRTQILGGGFNEGIQEQASDSEINQISSSNEHNFNRVSQYIRDSQFGGNGADRRDSEYQPSRKFSILENTPVMQDAVYNIDEFNQNHLFPEFIAQAPSIRVNNGSCESSSSPPVSMSFLDEDSTELGRTARFSTPIHAASQQNVGQMKELENYLKPKNQVLFYNKSV